MKTTNLQDISQRLVVITGASSGVGRAMAIELAKCGVKLVLAARREEALREVATECEALGSETLVFPSDTREADAMRQLANAAAEFGGKIDVWINNAGVLAAGPRAAAPS